SCLSPSSLCTPDYVSLFLPLFCSRFSALQSRFSFFSFFFFFNDTAPTEIYTLSLHDALPISLHSAACPSNALARNLYGTKRLAVDRKSTRLNSSHGSISYAVFCLKKKNKKVQSINSKRHNIQTHPDDAQ